jgi:hypothetical protein
LPRPRRPRRKDLVADFLGSWDGQLLLRLLGGSMTALLARLAMPNPWEGFDGCLPRNMPVSRQEALRERVAMGAPVPERERIRAVLAYADWKLTGEPKMPSGYVPETVEFLAPAHAAAINAMTSAAVVGFCARLRVARFSEVKRRALFGELASAGTEAMRRWPGIERRTSAPSLGFWPPAESEPLTIPDTVPEPTTPRPPGIS